MRRQDIQLLASARQGNVAAKIEVGRKYLVGADGFTRHVPTGLEYLTHPSLRGVPEVSKVIAESLTLPEIFRFSQEEALQLAAAGGSTFAQLKLGVWKVVRYPSGDGVRLLRSAAQKGHRGAAAALDALEKSTGDEGLVNFLTATSASEAGLGSAEVVALAAEEALNKRDVAAAARCLRVALRLMAEPTDAIAAHVLALVALAEEAALDALELPASSVQACLERKCVYGDYSGAYTLGRALCGFRCGSIESSSLVTATNFRKGAALLLRAADGGSADAWLDLYRVLGDHELSVANPQMARFCLEKSADCNNAEAQRKLGASLLRESNSLKESEHGIGWLFNASRQGDKIARRLLQSLVIPLPGSHTETKLALDVVAEEAPWLAVRLQLSRDFGLTKLEALTVDPAAGAREWGLVIGQNPFISQRLVASPRAVPAITDEALARLRTAADFFAQLRREGSTVEGDLRHRSRTQRTVFAKHQLSEEMFFAQVTSTQLAALRDGPKWAVRVKDLLREALATGPIRSNP